MQNVEIREIIRKSRIRYWEIARKMSMAPSNFSTLLQSEISPDRKEQILNAIEELKGE